jgi:hypothetical protein
VDIQFYGANCIVISTKQVRFVFDDNLASLGAKSITREGDVCLFTMQHHRTGDRAAKMTIDIAGEYESKWREHTRHPGACAYGRQSKNETLPYIRVTLR